MPRKIGSKDKQKRKPMSGLKRGLIIGGSTVGSLIAGGAVGGAIGATRGYQRYGKQLSKMTNRASQRMNYGGLENIVSNSERVIRNTMRSLRHKDKFIIRGAEAGGRQGQAAGALIGLGSSAYLTRKRKEDR